MVQAMAEGIDATDGWRIIRRNGQYFNASRTETDKGDPDLSSLAGKPVQVQVELRNADLFALQFLD